MRLFILFMIPFIGHLVVGCTSSHDVLVGSADETRASSTPISGDDTSTVEQFNERLREEIPTVTLRSGSEWTAVNVKLIRDSLSWTTPDFMATSRVHYAMIDRIVTIHRWHGAAEGLLRGLMAGAGAAAVIQGVTGKEDRGNLKGAIILSSGVLGGSLLGAIVGFIRGHREEYTFKRQTR